MVWWVGQDKKKPSQIGFLRSGSLSLFCLSSLSVITDDGLIFGADLEARTCSVSYRCDAAHDVQSAHDVLELRTPAGCGVADATLSAAFSCKISYQRQAGRRRAG
jgi:hypothetical protein